jgi:hypothetical protein
LVSCPDRFDRRQKTNITASGGKIMLAVNAGARLDRLPASRFHYRILALIGGGIVPRRIRYLSAGAVLAALIGIGWSTPAQNANFLSATFAGMVIGAWRKRARPAFRETDPLRK